MGPHGEGERGQVGLARGVDDPQRHPADVERLGGLQGADDEGHQVGGHHHGGGEADPALATRGGGLLDHRAVGVGGQGVVDHQGDLEGGLQLGLVPARKGPAGVGGLHLGGGDDVLDTGVVGEGRAVEAVQLVVEDAGERQVQGGRPGPEGLGEGQGDPLLVGVVGDVGGGQGVARVGVAVVELGEGHHQLGGVEGDGGRRRLHGDVDLHVAGEGRRRQVGGQDQPVGVGPDGGGEAVRGGLGRRVEVVRRSAHVGQATVAMCRATPNPTNLPSRL